MGACARAQAGEGAGNGCERRQQRQAEQSLPSLTDPGGRDLPAGALFLESLNKKTIRTQYMYLDVFTRFCRKTVK